MIPESWREAARELVAGWPELTEQDNRELTTLAVRHHSRRQQEATPADLPMAA